MNCMICKVDWHWVKWARVRRPGSGIQEYFIDVGHAIFFIKAPWGILVAESVVLLQNTTHNKMTTVPCSWHPTSVRSRQCWANIMKPVNAGVRLGRVDESSGKGWMDHKVDWQVGAVSAVMWMLCWPVVVTSELSLKAKLTIIPVYPTLFQPSAEVMSFGY